MTQVDCSSSSLSPSSLSSFPQLWSSLSSTEIWRQLVSETRKAGRYFHHRHHHRNHHHHRKSNGLCHIVPSKILHLSSNDGVGVDRTFTGTMRHWPRSTAATSWSVWSPFNSNPIVIINNCRCDVQPCTTTSPAFTKSVARLASRSTKRFFILIKMQAGCFLILILVAPGNDSAIDWPVVWLITS